MIKKVLAIAILCLILLGGFGIYEAYLYRQNLRQERQTAKAAQTSITLVEGWTNGQIADYLQNKGIVSSSIFLDRQRTTMSAPRMDALADGFGFLVLGSLLIVTGGLIYCGLAANQVQFAFRAGNH